MSAYLHYTKKNEEVEERVRFGGDPQPLHPARARDEGLPASLRAGRASDGPAVLREPLLQPWGCRGVESRRAPAGPHGLAVLRQRILPLQQPRLDATHAASYGVAFARPDGDTHGPADRADLADVGFADVFTDGFADGCAVGPLGTPQRPFLRPRSRDDGFRRTLFRGLVIFHSIYGDIS